MIIGVTSNNKNGKYKLSKYINENYLFKYLDADLILEKILKSDSYSNELLREDWRNNISLMLKIRNELDEEISKEYEELDHIKEVLVIDYSLLEDSFIFDKCDLVIKSCFNGKSKDNIEISKKDRMSSISSNYINTKYHLELNFDEDWESKLKAYIDYNIYNNTKVTVVVPIYNTVDYLSKCVNSITNQTYRNLEIILINDGSTDESLKMCELLAKKDPRIKVVNQKNVGLAETRNNGMELATGEYICFFDSDDYIENSMIETLLKTAEKTNADVCECGFNIHLKNGGLVDTSKEQKGVKFIEGKKDLINAYSDATILIPAWDKLYKLSSIKDIKFDKTCFKEDSDYIYKLCKEGKKFALVDIPFYHYIKRKDVSLTGSKISSKLFTFQDWGKEKYNELLSFGEEYRDAADKILYNTLVHIIRNYMRDHIDGVLVDGEYKNELQSVVNDTINLLLVAKDVKKFRKLDEVLEIINRLLEDNVLEKDKLPSVNLPCIGILWNSLNEEMINEAMSLIQERANITGRIDTDLEDKYREFINEIYLYNNEFEGIPVIKAGTLIDKYDTNTIVILNLIVKVSTYEYQGRLKGYVFKEVADLKKIIRKIFKNKIKDYAYDNIFHLTVDNDEFQFTDQVCRNLVKEYEENNND